MFEAGGPGGAATTATAVESLGAASAALARAVDGLLAVDPRDVADGDLADAMVGLRRLQARLAAVVAGHTAVFEAQGVYAADGSRSATDWIAVHARLPRPQVAGEVRDARCLASMPLAGAALRAGDISAAHVRVLARLAGHPRAGVHFPGGEAHLVDQARRARFDDWDRLCAYWRDAADPDGPEQRHGRDQDLRRFHLGVGVDGVGHPDGYLTPLATATLTGALERIETELFTADWAAAKQIHGDDVSVAHLARTAAQRRHDALLEMAVRASTAPADGKRPAPLVTVMVDYPTFAGRVCELAAGTVIAPGAVAELLGHDDTLIQRVVGDGANRIRDISTARSFRGTLRRILDITHRRCDHTTCYVPAHRCQGDHITAWSHGGPTSQTNGRLACGPHNRWWYTTGHNTPPPATRHHPRLSTTNSTTNRQAPTRHHPQSTTTNSTTPGRRTPTRTTRSPTARNRRCPHRSRPHRHPRPASCSASPSPRPPTSTPDTATAPTRSTSDPERPPPAADGATTASDPPPEPHQAAARGRPGAESGQTHHPRSRTAGRSVPWRTAGTRRRHDDTGPGGRHASCMALARHDHPTDAPAPTRPRLPPDRAPAATLADVTDRRPVRDRYDVVVVGGGHNALVAAAYLGRAGLSVCVLERADHVGGAAVSGRVFPGVDARLSRYSYLVSLLPDRIVADLGLDVTLASRPVASFTPVRRDGRQLGLLVERDPGPATAESFRALTGSDAEYAAWRAFYDDAARLAAAVAPTLLAPLEPAAAVRERVGDALWERFVARPIGETIEASFRDDTVRGVVLTDALIGTFASAHDATLVQNRCFLYHVVGNGTGEWRVPVGGMGAVTGALERAAREAGADLVTGAEVTGVDVDGRDAEVAYRHEGTDHVVAGAHVLAGLAPAVLDRLRGRPPAGPAPEGAQVKINMVLDRLPRLRSGQDPAIAFAGTFHIDEGYAALEAGHAAAAAGALPDPLPGEVYCHTLTDPSILSPTLAARGVHTLTLFGLHTPARLFADTRPGAGAVRDEAVRRHLAGLDAYLEEPIADCLARDADGRPCLEAVDPLDLEASLGLPGGHIFHTDLSWPWADGGNGAGDHPAARPGAWGVETDAANLFVCGAGARRGGGVSGLGGHNAAMAVLARVGARTA